MTRTGYEAVRLNYCFHSVDHGLFLVSFTHSPMQVFFRSNKTRASKLTLVDLPEDVVRLAFELAAEDIHVRLECALVSKQVQSWCVVRAEVGPPRCHLI